VSEGSYGVPIGVAAMPMDNSHFGAAKELQTGLIIARWQSSTLALGAIDNPLTRGEIQPSSKSRNDARF
jgi:hypothetical protein